LALDKLVLIWAFIFGLTSQRYFAHLWVQYHAPVWTFDFGLTARHSWIAISVQTRTLNCEVFVPWQPFCQLKEILADKDCF
jgi:hypothetical protein